jgi:hypothetical protein
VLIFFISGLIHMPPAVQDLVIQVGSNSGLGYVALLMLRLYVISPLLPLVPIVALGIVIHFLILSNKNSALLERRRWSQPLNLSASHTNNHRKRKRLPRSLSLPSAAVKTRY